MIFQGKCCLSLTAIIVGFGFRFWFLNIRKFCFKLIPLSRSVVRFLSVKAVGLTCIEFCIVYIIALIKTNKKVQKVKLIDLLNYKSE